MKKSDVKVIGVKSGKELKEFRYDLVIWAEDQQEADRVMVERVGYHEDLSECGVGDYKIDADPVDGRELDPLEVEEI